MYFMYLGWMALNLFIYREEHNSDALRINEILFAPSENELEFIEIINVADAAVNLCLYTFSDSRNLQETICEGTFEIPPSGFAVLARDGQALHEVFPTIDPITPLSWPALNNTGDTVNLYFQDNTVDSVTYLGTWGIRGQSIERKDPAGPSNQPFNWGPSKAITGATPGKTNSIYAPDLVPPIPILAEVQDEEYVFLVLNEFADVPTLQPSNFRITQEEPSRIAVLSDSTFLLHFPDGIRGQQLLIRNLRDLSNNQSGTTSIPLSYIPRQAELIITEIMYEPLNDDFDTISNQPEYLELYNTSNNYLSLRSLALAGEKDEMNSRDVFNTETNYEVLPPFSYVLIVASPTIEIAKQKLQDAFPPIISYLPSLPVLHIDRASLGLSNSGDYVCVSSSAEECVTELTYSPSMHHPGIASTRGVALERYSLSTSNLEGTNWSSSVAAYGGTPGWENSIHISAQGVEEDPVVQVYPSPFSPDGDGMDDVLTIHIQSPFTTSSINIRIFNSHGHQVRTLVPIDLTGSEATYLWDGRDDQNNGLPPGIYIFLIDILDVVEGEALTIKKVAVLANILN